MKSAQREMNQPERKKLFIFRALHTEPIGAKAFAMTQVYRSRLIALTRQTESTSSPPWNSDSRRSRINIPARSSLSSIALPFFSMMTSFRAHLSAARLRTDTRKDERERSSQRFLFIRRWTPLIRTMIDGSLHVSLLSAVATFSSQCPRHHLALLRSVRA